MFLLGSFGITSFNGPDKLIDQCWPDPMIPGYLHDMSGESSPRVSSLSLSWLALGGWLAGWLARWLASGGWLAAWLARCIWHHQHRSKLLTPLTAARTAATACQLQSAPRMV